MRDRVAFACVFLSDANLNDYIDQLSRQLIEDGNLDGMLLTGWWLQHFPDDVSARAINEIILL